MRFRPMWIAVPACAAAGVMSYSMVSAQDSRGVPLRPTAPDTRAAQSMFGPPPGAPGDPAPQPPLFFPNASPPPVSASQVPPPAMPPIPVSAPAAVPPSMPLPRVTVESTSPDPKPLPIIAPATPSAPSAPTLVISPAAAAPAPVVPPAMVVISSPAPVSPQPIAPSIAPQALPTMPVNPPITALPMASFANAMTFPNLPLMAKHSPNVVIECIAPETITVGQSFDYVLLVKNTGSSTVANVRIEDELPAGAKFISSEPVAEQNGTRLAWSFGILEAASEKRIKVTVKPGDEGEMRSRAMVSFTAAAESRVRVTRPRIAIALVGCESVRVGDEVPFQIRVTNTGSGPATNLILKAKITDGLHHPAGGQVEALIERLPAGETKTITLRTLATKAGSNGCNITATGEGLVVEPAQSIVSIVEPLLTAKVSGPVKCLVRSEPEFRIELANPGSAATDPVRVWAVVPEGFDFLSATEGGNYHAANRTVMWNLPALSMASNRTIAVKVKATAACDAALKVIAQSVPAGENGVVAAGGRSNATRILEAKAEAAVKAEGVPGLRFDVTAVEDPVEVGKEAVYDIRIANHGSGACTNVVVTATLADGTTTAGATGPTTARGQGQQIAFDALPLLAAKGETVYRVRVRGLQAGDMKLRVQVGCDELRAPIAKEENTRFVKD